MGWGLLLADELQGAVFVLIWLPEGAIMFELLYGRRLESWACAAIAEIHQIE
jgi:hypothetical protein